MKKLVVFLAIHFLCYQGLKAEDKENPRQARVEIPAWQTQMMSYLGYPEILRKSNWEGTIQVIFQLDDDSRISQVYIQMDNLKAKAKLTSQLLGKKLTDSSLSPQQTYTLRVKFLLED